MLLVLQGPKGLYQLLFAASSSYRLDSRGSTQNAAFLCGLRLGLVYQLPNLIQKFALAKMQTVRKDFGVTKARRYDIPAANFINKELTNHLVPRWKATHSCHLHCRKPASGVSIHHCTKAVIDGH